MKTTEMRFRALAIAVAAASLGLAHAAGAEEADGKAATWQQAFTEGDVGVNFRYRYEHVDEDNPRDNANASTLKSRLNFKTKAYMGLTGFVEFDNVSSIGDADYDSLRNGNTDYSVVADPTGTDVNQAWVSLDGPAATRAAYGRQRILLDNQRFVGGVGWRQNEQTYDGFTLVNTAVEGLTATYDYVYRVQRVFGPDKADAGEPPEELDSENHFVNLSYAGLPWGTLTGYYYDLDFDDAAALSTLTFGARFAGKAKIGDNLSLPYAVEYARQEDNADNPKSYDVDYYLLEAGVETSFVAAKLSYEVLEGDAGKGAAFQTPLATLHAFQGWADRFLTTPAAGIEDAYLSIDVPIALIDSKLSVVYHDFQANDSGQDWGTEWDVSLSHKFCNTVTGLLKYADYDADDWSVDTRKLWVQLEVSF